MGGALGVGVGIGIGIGSASAVGSNPIAIPIGWLQDTQAEKLFHRVVQRYLAAACQIQGEQPRVGLAQGTSQGDLLARPAA